MILPNDYCRNLPRHFFHSTFIDDAQPRYLLYIAQLTVCLPYIQYSSVDAYEFRCLHVDTSGVIKLRASFRGCELGTESVPSLIVTCFPTTSMLSYLSNEVIDQIFCFVCMPLSILSLAELFPA